MILAAFFAAGATINAQNNVPEKLGLPGIISISMQL